jgi:hypothetical protein
MVLPKGSKLAIGLRSKGYVRGVGLPPAAAAMLQGLRMGGRPSCAGHDNEARRSQAFAEGALLRFNGRHAASAGGCGQSISKRQGKKKPSLCREECLESLRRLRDSVGARTRGSAKESKSGVGHPDTDANS